MDFIMIREYNLYDFDSLKSVEVYFMAQEMVYLSECSKGP